MSNTVNQLGGKCPYMPFLGRGQISGGGGGGGGGGGTCPTLVLDSPCHKEAFWIAYM